MSTFSWCFRPQQFLLRIIINDFLFFSSRFIFKFVLFHALLPFHLHLPHDRIAAAASKGDYYDSFYIKYQFCFLFHSLFFSPSTSLLLIFHHFPSSSFSILRLPPFLLLSPSSSFSSSFPSSFPLPPPRLPLLRLPLLACVFALLNAF